MFAFPRWLLAFVVLAAMPAAAEVTRIQVLSSDFLLPGKVNRLQRLANPHGIAVQADFGKGATAETLATADLLILDTPRGSDRAEVMGRVGAQLKAGNTPWLVVGGGPPQGGNLSPVILRPLLAYYAAGGEANFRNMMAFIRAWQDGSTLSAIPPAVPLPGAGIYHSGAEQIFPDWAAYQDWGQHRWSENAPVLAVAMSRSVVSNGETALYDDLIASVEAAGGIPLVFWFERGKADALASMIAQARPAMLVNTTHMVDEARKAEFPELNIPVVMGLSYRNGTVAQWRDAAQGMPAASSAALMVIPEGWGMSDPLVLTAVENGSPVAIPEQLALLVERFKAQAALRNTAAIERRLAMMFWNSPAGEKNLSASNLNIPRSIENIIEALVAQGYSLMPEKEADIIATAQRLLGAYYHPEQLDALLADGLAVTLPLASYRNWLATLPASRQQALQNTWGEPDSHWGVRTIDGEPQFVIPAARRGNLLYLPQPPRADRPGESTHDLIQPPGHFYLAVYLYLREQFAAHALIHLGTHGTQEWTPGKDRGLWAYDYPNLAVGNVPVFYPYIQDNIGEAMQAKRRGRAVTISHQTPPFAPSGFYDELQDIHDLMHQYLQLESGAVRDATKASLLAVVEEHKLNEDLGWTSEAMHRDTEPFIAVLHDHLHQLAQANTPIGLHSFGESAGDDYRWATVMQQLGEEYYRALELDTTELFADSFEQLFESPAYRYLPPYLRGEKSADAAASKELSALMQRAQQYDTALRNNGEIEALITGLAGGFVRPGPGGDPVRNPGTSSGTNLYALDPHKIPSPEAYRAAEETYRELIDDYRSNHQAQWPDKLAFSLWSSETIRTLGLSEAQIMQALGVKPVWDAGGQVVGLEIIPVEELGRPRVDAVIHVTSVYRDQFDAVMDKLSVVLEKLAGRDEANNPIAENSRRLASLLREQGVPMAEAGQYASARIFSNPPGDYGSGVTRVAMDSTEWDDSAVLAETFLNSQSHIYSQHHWGRSVKELGVMEAQLNGVDAVLLSRSSNLHGLLSTDHPFEYLGGLSATVNHVSGERPALYVSNARSARASIASASTFLSSEMRTRYQNPQWINGMKAEGYAGTVAMLKVVNNLFGWQVMDPNMVREDQWQAMHDTYVMDRRELGLNEWFAEHNPTAQAQVIERMAEAIRKGYWDASEQTRKELVERWQTLTSEEGAQPGADKTVAFLKEQAAGFGMSWPEAASEAAEASAAEPQVVKGQVLEAVQAEDSPQPPSWWLWGAWLLLALSFLAGAASNYYHSQSFRQQVKASC
ncbi:cobaltochelatase subunit CobN [Spongiibacter tropicus]|uniref:cobaltochelatase subunit CobN n=1 Tax=Spongiibacter tropicus TaxID=454602 RepID=UPI0023563B79|nr:cobaltochelatase subunit CobN [Spongiibacter tropicus]|tara:strand:+ start:2432 stop:6292 length:3861 start_codon:yes stop_codon:yes gene_type:complete